MKYGKFLHNFKHIYIFRQFNVIGKRMAFYSKTYYNKKFKISLKKAKRYGKLINKAVFKEYKKLNNDKLPHLLTYNYIIHLLKCK